MPPFLLDTNFFIAASRTGFPMDVVPSFWEQIKKLAEGGFVISIDKVKGEIFNNDDGLKAWCESNLPEDFFKDTTEVVSEYRQVVNWAYSKKDNPYTQQALEVFMDADEADAWLIAYAMAKDLRIVTNETSEPNRKTAVKIPDAGQVFNVRCILPMNMLRELGVRI